MVRGSGRGATFVTDYDTDYDTDHDTDEDADEIADANYCDNSEYDRRYVMYNNNIIPNKSWKYQK